MLLSRHRDADILSRIAYHLGFEFVRGSTRRGGVAALRQLLARSRYMHLTITPDGPRGPRRQLAPGAVFLASRLGLPLVLMGFGFDRPWRAKSWDRFAIPRPFSGAITSPQIHVPPTSTGKGWSTSARVEAVLNRLTDEAEARAAAGRTRTAVRGDEPARSLAGRISDGFLPARLRRGPFPATDADHRWLVSYGRPAPRWMKSSS